MTKHPPTTGVVPVGASIEFTLIFDVSRLRHLEVNQPVQLPLVDFGYWDM